MATAKDRFELLASAYLEGAAGTEDREALAVLLREDATLRRRFVELCRIDGLLRAHFATPGTQAAFVRRAMKALPARGTGEATVKGVMRKLERQAHPASLRWVALGAAALLVLSLGVWLGRQGSRIPGTGPHHVPSEPGGEVVQVPAQADAITIANLEGGVFAVKAGTRNAAKAGGRLAKGDILETTGDGRATLVFPGGSSLDVLCAGQPGRLLVQTEADDDGRGYELLLQSGIAEGEIRRGAKHGPFVIRSAEAEARVAGTRLRVAATASVTRLEVYTGKVDFVRLADQQSIAVNASESAEVAPGVSLAAAKSPSRDPGVWPFDARSPWNLPLGAQARYEDETSPILDLNGGVLTQATEWTYPIAYATPADREVGLIQNTTGKEIFRLQAPASARPDSGGGALIIVDPAHRFAMELGAAFWRGDGNLQAKFANRVDLRGYGVFSEPSGGRVYGGSALGGLIRQSELAGGIPHALAISVAHKALNANAPGGKAFVWPASDSMSNPQANYGNSGNVYMGSLLAIPPDVKLEDLGVGRSGPAFEVAKALQDYGAYVVESFTKSRQSVFFFADPACRSEIPTDFDANLSKVIRALKVVSNNAPQTPGGGGTPRRPLAPAFKDFSSKN